MSDLWIKETWSNPAILYLFNTRIYEYDIKSAGTSISKYYKLLDEKTLEKLESLPKDKRVVEEGNLQRNDKEYKEALKKGFENIRKEFFLANNLEEEDIISIKKDAIFTTKKVKVSTFGPVKFVTKNKYSSYINARGKEYYYSIDQLDIKGMGDNINLHVEGMLIFITSFFDKMENSDKKDVLRYVRNFFTSYKQYKLPVDYYREFNPNSFYRPMTDNKLWAEWWDDRKTELDISYNMQNIIIPFTKISM